MLNTVVVSPKQSSSTRTWTTSTTHEKRRRRFFFWQSKWRRGRRAVHARMGKSQKLGLVRTHGPALTQSRGGNSDFTFMHELTLIEFAHGWQAPGSRPRIGTTTKSKKSCVCREIGGSPQPEKPGQRWNLFPGLRRASGASGVPVPQTHDARTYVRA
jgi:hypothetical protein